MGGSHPNSHPSDHGVTSALRVSPAPSDVIALPEQFPCHGELGACDHDQDTPVAHRRLDDARRGPVFAHGSHGAPAVGRGSLAFHRSHGHAIDAPTDGIRITSRRRQPHPCPAQ